jgi:hypothetical protein
VAPATPTSPHGQARPAGCVTLSIRPHQTSLLTVYYCPALPTYPSQQHGTCAGLLQLPASITCLTQLRQLDLAYNGLRALPQGLALPLLEDLSLDSNCLRWAGQVKSAAAGVLAAQCKACT